jgi:hypothetical protein
MFQSKFLFVTWLDRSIIYSIFKPNIFWNTHNIADWCFIYNFLLRSSAMDGKRWLGSIIWGNDRNIHLRIIHVWNWSPWYYYTMTSKTIKYVRLHGSFVVSTSVFGFESYHRHNVFSFLNWWRPILFFSREYVLLLCVIKIINPYKATLIYITLLQMIIHLLSSRVSYYFKLHSFIFCSSDTTISFGLLKPCQFIFSIRLNDSLI